MNLEDFTLGWREALIGAIVCLGLYVIWMVFRLRRLRSQLAQPSAQVLAGSRESTVTAPSFVPPVFPSTEELREQGEDREELPFPWNEPPEESAPAADPEADILRRLEAAERMVDEVVLMRDELAMMRDELATVRAEMLRQLERLQAAQHIAPIYGDAMQMAAAGYDAATIAERCGVARAEAELVVALLRSQSEDEMMREK